LGSPNRMIFFLLMDLPPRCQLGPGMGVALDGLLHPGGRVELPSPARQFYVHLHTPYGVAKLESRR
jgi:hypothetical protein